MTASLQLINKDGLDRVHLVCHSTVDQTECHKRASDDMVLTTLHILIDLSQTLVHVPQEEESETSSCRCLTIVLALKDPVLVVLLLKNKLILAKGSIHKRIDIGHGKVLLSTVDSIILEPSLLEMTLIDSARVLGLHHVEITSE